MIKPASSGFQEWVDQGFVWGRIQLKDVLAQSFAPRPSQRPMTRAKEAWYELIPAHRSQ